jgi:hypothetical protein
VRTRLALLALATLIALVAAPALADEGPGDGSGPAHQGSSGSGSGDEGSGGEGSGGSGSDDHGPNGSGRGSPRPLRTASVRPFATEPGPLEGSVADQREGDPRPSTAPPNPASASGGSPTPASASAAGQPATPIAAVAGVAGAVLLLVAMVVAGFRARARLGRLG